MEKKTGIWHLRSVSDDVFYCSDCHGRALRALHAWAISEDDKRLYTEGSDREAQSPERSSSEENSLHYGLASLGADRNTMGNR